MILHDYACLAHGYFESDKPECPHGCNTVIKVHLKAPGLLSNKTKFADKQLAGLAKDFNLPDLSNRNGSVMESLRKQGTAPVWLDNEKDQFKEALNIGSKEGGASITEMQKLGRPKPLIVAEHKGPVPKVE
jgi:hypothetical protein